MCLRAYMMEVWTMCAETVHGLLGTREYLSLSSHYPLTPELS